MRRWFVVALAVGLVLGVFILVGFWAGDHRFAWDPAAVSATAVATTGLAGATGWLTIAAAAATQRSSDVNVTPPGPVPVLPQATRGRVGGR